MRILDFEVEDLDGFVKLEKSNASYDCGTKVLGVDNVARRKIAGINPAANKWIIPYLLLLVNKKLRTWRNSEEFFQVRRKITFSNSN